MTLPRCSFTAMVTFLCSKDLISSKESTALPNEFTKQAHFSYIHVASGTYKDKVQGS